MKKEKDLDRATKARQAGETKRKRHYAAIGQGKSNTTLVNPLNWSIIFNLVASMHLFSPIINYICVAFLQLIPASLGIAGNFWHLLSSIHVAFASLQTFDPLVCCSKRRYGS